MSNVFRRTSRAAGRSVAVVLLLGGIAAGTAGCGGGSDAGSATTSAGASADAPLEPTAFEAASSKPGTTLIDVRTPGEFASGHLAGAVNLDVQSADFANAVDQLDKAGSYAVYCHSGNRSAVAVSFLRDHGFTSVVELAGGIAAWQAAGMPVTTD